MGTIGGGQCEGTKETETIEQLDQARNWGRREGSNKLILENIIFTRYVGLNF